MDHGRPDELENVLQRGYRYALGLTHEPAAAEDLVQEACLRLGRGGGPWNAPYLIKTVRNLFVDDHRRRQRVRFEELEGPDAATAAPHPDPDEELQRALGRLRPEEREMVFLAVVEGYTTSEIAELTGRPRGTVLSSIHRAKEKLRRLLGTGETRTVS